MCKLYNYFQADWNIIKEVYENKDFCSVATPSQDLRY